MTLIVEDGTVVTDANSYVTVAEADTFLSDQGETLWTVTAELISPLQKEAALIRAAQYLQQRYRMIWKGSRVEAFQSLDWPRRGVDVPDFFDPFYRQINVPLAFQDTVFIALNVVPEEVKQAQIWLALNVLDSTGQATATLQASIGRKTKREKAGSLEVEYMTAEEGGDTRQTTVYWNAARLIEPFLRPSTPQTGTLVRA